jgi:2-dehydropantoate 2-reductase
MGMLFGGYLSKKNEVVLIDIEKTRVDKINKEGIRIREPGREITTAGPMAALSAGELGEMDLVILFVKAMNSRSALGANRSLIGPATWVLSLQNGAGHDAVMKKFVAEKYIAIGTTQHNSSVVGAGVVHHGGGGKTFIGSIGGDERGLKAIEETFNRCGFDTEISDNIHRRIWEKLFINASVSALTAILQTRLGFLLESGHAWSLARQLIREAVAVANAEGMGFKEEEVVRDVRKLVENARDAYTSIYADIRDGRKTEVDAISGAVVSAGRRHNVPTPNHEFVTGLIHAMEDPRTPESATAGEDWK